VAEQVEHFRVRCPLAHPVPLRGHVGEEAEVAEGRQAGMKADIASRQRPIAWDVGVTDPTPAAFLVRTRHEGRVGRPVAARRSPPRLRLGADHGDRAVAFPLLAIAAVDQAPVMPGLADDGNEVAHAARASLPPIEAMARGPLSMADPAAFAAVTSTARS